MKQHPVVVVVGGGFGGLNAAQSIGKLKRFDIIVIDRRNHHLFQPLLYQVAMAGLSPADISTPIRAVLSKLNNTKVFFGEVFSVNVNSKLVITDFGEVKYDYLILACGSKHSYFGHNEWEEYAPGLKTVEQATEIRRRVLSAFELAERETNLMRKKELLTFVIVGGGPTGVELAGAISELSRHTLTADFSNIDDTMTKIILIEAGPRILASFSPESSTQAERDLTALGVTMMKNTKVTKIDGTTHC
jgi:NADH dehydrogenase